MKPLRTVGLIAAIVFGLWGHSHTIQDGTAILERADQVFNKSECYQYITRLNIYGQERMQSSYLMRTLRKGSDLMLIVFLEPRRIKGQTILRNSDDQWIYFPKIRRTLKISSRQQLVGSDFSYGDILNLNLVKEYSAELLAAERLEGGVPCHRLKLSAKSPTALYNQVDYLVRQNDFAAIRRDYYAKSGELLKILFFSKHDRELMPRRWEMQSRLTPGNKTTMLVEKIEKVDDLPDAYFSLHRLVNR